MAAAENTKPRSENFINNSQNSKGISLVIPRVFPNFGYREIKQLFINVGWGFVERVDVVPPGRIPKGRFKTVFVHFRPNSWNTRDNMARQVLKKLQQGPKSYIKLTYDDPWYWKVYISRNERPNELKPKKKPPQQEEGAEMDSDDEIKGGRKYRSKKRKTKKRKRKRKKKTKKRHRKKRTKRHR